MNQLFRLLLINRDPVHVFPLPVQQPDVGHDAPVSLHPVVHVLAQLDDVRGEDLMANTPLKSFVVHKGAVRTAGERFL